MKKLVLLVVGLGLLVAGYLGGNWTAQHKTAAAGAASSHGKVLYYVDPMNPAHTSTEPGLAPCGMKMEPVYADVAVGGSVAGGEPLIPGTVSISAEKQQLIGVQTVVVEKTNLSRALRLLGKVAPDETRVYRINATVDGWITTTTPLATGDRVAKEQTLAAFYSPEFLSAGQAFLFALTSQDRVITTAPETAIQSNQVAQFNLNLQQYRDSLRNLGMGEKQIEEMMHTRRFAQNVNIVSPADGFITTRNVSDGLRFDKGTELFRITDLSRVWILADVFEKDARSVSPGTMVRVSPSGQQQSFSATVSAALPQFDTSTRTLKLRLEAANPDFVLKPGQFVDMEVPVSLPESLIVPADAVLDAGLRQTVFVERGASRFEPRAVVTGERSSGQVQILQGLMAGERIVVSGNFLIDSESRIKRAAAGVHGPPNLDPVCGMAVDKAKARAANRFAEHGGRTFFFCCNSCKEDFVEDPAKFLKSGDVIPASSVTTNQEPNPSRDQSHH